MKVNELRSIIKKYNEEDKEKIIIELYKKIPKYVKEDYNIDEYIIDINKKVEKEDILSIDTLSKEIEFFLQCAKDNLYAIPNKIIPKGERSKWRFKVKKFYKELNSFLPTTDDGKKATDLLKKIYKILSYGTNYLTFSSWNTFGAIQVRQSEFLKNIVERKLINGITRENVSYCIDLLNYEYDPQEYHRDVLDSFQSCLKTVDAKELAIELLKEQANIWKEKYKNKDDYENQEYNNYLVECIFNIYIDLCEQSEAIKYFHKQYIESCKEVKEFVLLELLEEHGHYNEWILEYEKYLGKIKYRESLQEKYKKIKSKLNN